MFKRFAEALLRVLKNLTREIERAYFETYGDEELAQEFGFEVEMRKQRNKDLFVRNAAIYMGKKILEKDNFLIPENVALEMGEMMFESAKQEGRIDILNNCIDEKERK